MSNVEVANNGVFYPGVIWRTLAPSDETLVDPNAGTNLYAPPPNISDRSSRPQTEGGVIKRNYGQTFDRPPFIASIDIDLLDRFKRRRVDRVTKKVLTEKKMVEDNGMPRPEFL